MRVVVQCWLLLLLFLLRLLLVLFAIRYLFVVPLLTVCVCIEFYVRFDFVCWVAQCVFKDLYFTVEQKESIQKHLRGSLDSEIARSKNDNNRNLL